MNIFHKCKYHVVRYVTIEALILAEKSFIAADKFTKNWLIADICVNLWRNSSLFNYVCPQNFHIFHRSDVCALCFRSNV